MATVLMVAAPPASSSMWTDVIARLRASNVDAKPIELWDPAPATPTVDGLATAVVQAVEAETEPCVLVGHGTAVPIVRQAAAQTDVAGLVITNGPLTQVDPATRTLASLARSPRALARTLMQPAAWNRWLASSVGMRRTVINPYVMDRDTVVALTEPYLRTGKHREATATFLRSLRDLRPPPPPRTVNTMLIWGDEDRLYAPSILDSSRSLFGDPEIRVVPGGQHFHPIERPWYIADEIAQWMASELG